MCFGGKPVRLQFPLSSPHDVLRQKNLQAAFSECNTCTDEGGDCREVLHPLERICFYCVFAQERMLCQVNDREMLRNDPDSTLAAHGRYCSPLVGKRRGTTWVPHLPRPGGTGVTELTELLLRPQLCRAVFQTQPLLLLLGKPHTALMLKLPPFYLQWVMSSYQNIFFIAGKIWSQIFLPSYEWKYKHCRFSQGATSVGFAFQLSRCVPIHLANCKDHTMYFEGQCPINIMLNKTSFHAEKSTHQQTSRTLHQYCLAENQCRRIRTVVLWKRPNPHP